MNARVLSILALAAAAMALVITALWRQKPLTLDDIDNQIRKHSMRGGEDDQPVIISGGSLRMRGPKVWKYDNGGYVYSNPLPDPLTGDLRRFNRVALSCNHDGDPVQALTRQNGQDATITIVYGAGNFETKLTYTISNTGIRLDIADRQNNPVKRGVSDAFTILGDMPRHNQKAQSITSTKLYNGATETPLACTWTGPTQGDFILSLEPVTVPVP